MNAGRISLFALSCIFAIITTGLCADKIELIVKVDAKTTPLQVMIYRLPDFQPTDLNIDPADKAYKVSISLPFFEAKDNQYNLSLPFLLIASWGEEKEQLYLIFRPITPKRLPAFTIYHHPINEGYQRELNEIEALGSDPDSLLRKYFRARDYHKLWRNRKLENHPNAIRSAMIWYQAAYMLVERHPLIYRMDEEVDKIMQDYDKMALIDPRFNEKYNRYANSKYILNTRNHLVALEHSLDYAFVGRIPGLLAEGNLDKAKEFNTVALTTLSQKPKKVQQLILINQRINLDLLKNNARYIKTLESHSAACEQ